MTTFTFTVGRKANDTTTWQEAVNSADEPEYTVKATIDGDYLAVVGWIAEGLGLGYSGEIDDLGDTVLVTVVDDEDCVIGFWSPDYDYEQVGA